MRNTAILIVILLTTTSAKADAPKATDKRLVVELFAEHPQLVTPTGLAVADDGRVFVAESHTHFRPEDYDGPKADRILIFEDTDSNGRADKRTIFHEGFTHVMDIEFHADGSLYVATRMDIHRMRDTDGDDKADEVTRIAWLDTKGNYPHNGLSGLAFHADGSLSFGLGENLGAEYTLNGIDGSKFSGGGEGGSTYQVKADGTKLRRVSTGWWNPYGMCVDAVGRVFGTDNDPGASPPCRLIQVIEGANYGYEYRYGRTGLHPLITWTGDMPGTLPMISGTGEAPCAIVAYDGNAFPSEYQNNLFVPCWADHRVERYTITQQPDKGLVDAERKTLIEGDDDFRPVGIDVAPDGSVYISDWVSSSYSLHKLGRIWRIKPRQSATSGKKRVNAPQPQTPHQTPNVEALTRLIANNGDPLFIHQGIEKLAAELTSADLRDSTRSPAILLAARRSKTLTSHFATEHLRDYLAAENADSRFLAVKWIADEKLVDYRPDLERMLKASDLDYRQFRAVAAAMDRLDNKEPSDQPSTKLLLAKIKDDDAPVAIRRLCLRMIAPDADGLKLEKLVALTKHEDRQLRIEAVRTLAEHPDSQRADALIKLASDKSQSPQLRATAIAGLAVNADAHVDFLIDIARDSGDVVRDEALRCLVGAKLDRPQRQQLLETGETNVAARLAIQRALQHNGPTPPRKEQTERWKQRLTGNGDASTGERIFFGAKVGTCSKCHTIDGRGSAVGPDLSKIRQRVASEGIEWLLETILQPSKQMAPQYTPWQIVTKDGKTLVGLPRRKGGNQEAYLGIDGKEFSVKKPNIELHREMPTSIMPEGLLQTLTDQELNDLIAFIAGE